MSRASEWWAGLTPQNRKTLMSVGVLGMLLVFLYLFMAAGPEQKAKAETTGKVDKNLLTGSDPKALGLDALGGKVREAERGLRETNERVQALEKQTTKGFKDVNDVLERIRAGIDEMRRDTQAKIGTIQQQQQRDLTSLRRDFDSAQKTESEEAAPKPGTIDKREAKERGLFEDGPMLPAEAGPQRKGAEGGAANSSEAVRVRVFGESDQAKTKATQDNEEGVYIPAGAIIAGVLITGVDAPTHLQSKRDPMPALIRIKHDAILPNRYRADVKECFLVVATTGDLSTERAFMRGETLSCIRKNGAVIETVVDSYVAGEDGKAGMRGRLVHRNGSLVAKSMAAGFLSALSDITRPVQVQGLNTSPDKDALFQRPQFSDVAEAGAFGGASEAMRRLADYYIDLAEEIRPFVEIDAGRKVESILLGGVTLKLRS